MKMLCVAEDKNFLCVGCSHREIHDYISLKSGEIHQGCLHWKYDRKVFVSPRSCKCMRATKRRILEEVL